MDEPRDTNPPEFPSGDIWNDVPLFREIQRVLMSSAGSPVNWELARQVGIATASSTGEDPPPSEADQRGFEESVRIAELHVTRLTGLEAPGEIADVQAVRRTQWVQANLEGLRSLIEPTAAKLGEAAAQMQPEDASSGAFGAQQLLANLTPLLLGAQVGSVLGYLGQHVLGQYDIAVPRPSGGVLMFVTPNIAAFERDWSLSATEFRTWVAIHEVTHRFEFSHPWARRRFQELLDDFTATLELDVAGLQLKIVDIDPSDPDALRKVLEEGDGLLGAVLDDEQRLKLARIQAFMSAAEGFGDHVMHAIGRELLPSYGQIEEAMRRYRESEHTDPVFERLLGIEMKREQYRLGRRFCDTVVELTDEATLARMWEAAEALPSLPELEEPRLWLARTA